MREREHGIELLYSQLKYFDYDVYAIARVSTYIVHINLKQQLMV